MVLYDKLYQISNRKNIHLQNELQSQDKSSTSNQNVHTSTISNNKSNKNLDLEADLKVKQNLWQQKTKVIRETARENNFTQTQLLIKPSATGKEQSRGQNT